MWPRAQPWEGAVLAFALAAGATEARGQPVTAVVTHGFTVGAKGAWVQGMGEAILARAGQGALYRYEAATGRWQFLTQSGAADDVVVLIFNWTDESDAVAEGPNWGYTQAAADALYASLRQPRYAGGTGPADLVSGRAVHLVGHSRGACVMSETARRLSLAGDGVDQLTALDPHPVNGTLDPPLDFDWGDPVPQKWDGVSWADNYWRADGGFLNAFDFDGIALANFTNRQLSESVLNCTESTTCLGQADGECGYSQAHSDTHLWYHGTIDLAPAPDDGEECISSLMRSTWWQPGGYAQDGYYFAVPGGGSAFRPGQLAGIVPEAVPVVHGGDFDEGSFAGWSYHGGGGTGTVSADGGEWYLRLTGSPAAQRTHNRFWLPAGAVAIQYDYRLLATTFAGDQLRLRLQDPDGAVNSIVDTITFSATGGWVLARTADLPAEVTRPGLYLLTFEVQSGAGSGASVGIDNVMVLVSDCPWDLDRSGDVGSVDFLDLLAQWGTDPGGPPDFDGDGSVGVADFLALLSHWGGCP